MIRVLYITHVGAMDGANRSLLQLIEELRANHHVTPIVVCPREASRNGQSIATECKTRGIECYVLPLVKFKLAAGKSLIEKLKIFLSFVLRNVNLMFKLRKVKFDLVHSNSSVIDMGSFVSMARGVPHVWHLREFGYEDFRLVSVFGKRYERWIYAKCTCAIAISKVIEEKFRPYFNDRIRLIYNGIVPKDERLWSKHDNKVTTFCLTGRVEPNKNQLEALKAAALIKKQTEHDFRIWIVGHCDKNYAEILKKYVADNGLENQVVFLGYRTDVPQILQRSDVGLMLSTNEAFGRVTVEYMMQNLAVIASDTGANPEIITNGETGLLYELGDVEGLADKMKSLIEDHTLLEALAEKGKQHAYRHFTSVMNSNQIFSLYQTIENKKGD